MPDEQVATGEPTPEQAQLESPQGAADDAAPADKGKAFHERFAKIQAAAKPKQAAQEETAPAPPDGQEPQQEPGEFQPSDSQRALCKQIGLSDDDIAKMSNVEIEANVKAAKAMSRAMGKLGRELKTLRDENAKLKEQPAAAPNAHRQDTETAGQPSSMAAPQESEFSVETFGDDATVQTLNAMKQEMKALQQRLETAESQRVENEAKVLEQQSEAFIEKLDPEIFGKYFTADDAVDNREELISMALGIKDAHEDVSGRSMTLETAFKAALAALAPEELEAQHTRGLQEKIKQRQGQFAQRPSQRKAHEDAKPQTREEKAALVAAEMRARYPGYGR